MVHSKPPLQLHRPPAEKPARKPLRFEIREVKTGPDREAYDRLLTKALEEEIGWDKKKIDHYDAYFRGHRRFVACLLEEEPGRIVGTGMFAENPWKGKYTVARLSVEEDFRLRGIMTAIMARIEEEAKKMGLTEIILFCAKNLIDIHSKSGFKLVENLGKEPGDREDSYLMEKKLE